MDSITKAQREGRKAAMEFKTIASNPYPEMTKEGDAWHDSFKDEEFALLGFPQ